jgi:hypothetical protein
MPLFEADWGRTLGRTCGRELLQPPLNPPNTIGIRFQSFLVFAADLALQGVEVSEDRVEDGGLDVAHPRIQRGDTEETFEERVRIPLRIVRRVGSRVRDRLDDGAWEPPAT